MFNPFCLQKIKLENLKNNLRNCAQLLCCVQLFVILWTVAHQALLSMGILRARILEGVAMPSSRGFPNTGIEPRSPALQADSLLSEPPGKPMNTGMGSLSILQGNFPAQELNRGLLHCRWILYQLSYQGSPLFLLHVFKFRVCCLNSVDNKLSTEEINT